MKKTNIRISQKIVILSFWAFFVGLSAQANLNECRQALGSQEALNTESLPQVSETVRETPIDFRDASALERRKGIYKYPQAIDPTKDVLLLIDKNGHFSLSSQQVEFNGRVINKPIDLTSLNQEQHDKIAIIRLNNLTLEEKARIVEGMNSLEGKRSLSCLNAIEFLLDESIGLRTTAVRGKGDLHPSIAEVISKPWARKDGSLVKTTVYKFTSKSFTKVIERIYSMERLLQIGSPLTLPGWIGIALDPASLVKFLPENEQIPDEKMLPSEFREIKERSKMEKAQGVATTLWNWLYSTVHNAGGAYQVVKYMTFQKMKHGLIPVDHPWVTGISPDTKKTIYSENIVFASPRSDKFKTEPDSDEKIINRVGSFLAAMAKKSTGPIEVPKGPARRMPHVVNYLHGDISFNGGTLLFNNFKDAMFYLSDKNFVRELYRFVEIEKREFLIVLRERDYDPAEYAVFLGFIRSTLKWYANANGPQQRVLYGVPAAYPVINVINGNWVKTISQLEKGELDNLIRPPIPVNHYFQASYQGSRDSYSMLEATLAYYNYLIVKMRGFQGGFVFTLRKTIEPRQYQEYQAAKERGENPQVIAPVKSPWLFIKQQNSTPIKDEQKTN